MKIFGCFVLISLIVTCYGQAPSDDIPEAERPNAKIVGRANTRFTTDLYGVLRSSHPTNLIFSSMSLSAVIAMLKAGARGKTATEIQKGMSFPENDNVLFTGYRTVLNAFKSNDDFSLEVANRIYSQDSFKLQDNFTKTLTQYFNADAVQLDFKESKASADKINGWVKEKTRGKIENLIGDSDLSELTRLVLINAIYFKGSWESKFDPKRTVKEQFYVSETKNVTVDMMKFDGDFQVVAIDELKSRAISLPYKGGKLSMIIVLPNEKKGGLETLEAGLKNFQLAKISELLNEQEKKKVSLSMPKFKLESEIDLKEPLTKLGMGSIFEDNADFSGIPQDKVDLKVSKAVQKAFIEVNEEGSEAAAATGVIIMTRSGNPRPKIESFIIDQPFLAYIHEGETDTNLFMASVSDPTEERSTSGHLRAAEGAGGKANHGFRETAPWSFLPLLTLIAFARFL